MKMYAAACIISLSVGEREWRPHYKSCRFRFPAPASGLEKIYHTQLMPKARIFGQYDFIG
jgi:hypothetical protein